MSKPIIPVTRLSNFFDENDMNFMEDMVKEYYNDVVNFVVILFKIDRERTEVDELYNETNSDGLILKAPVELMAINLIIGDQELTSYTNNGVGIHRDYGNLNFDVLVGDLKEKNITIDAGDIVGYNISETDFALFEIIDDGRNSVQNKFTIGGYRPYLKSIKTVQVDKSKFKGFG